MFQRTLHLSTYVVLLTMVNISVVAANIGEEEKKGTRVLATEIGKSVEIVGRLGFPLGEIITIRGKWREPPETSKSPRPLLDVEMINGKKCEKAIDFGTSVLPIRSRVSTSTGKPSGKWEWKYDWGGEMAAPSPTAGEEWELIGIETGGFRSHSTEVQKIIGRVSGPSGFLTHFEFFGMRKISPK